VKESCCPGLGQDESDSGSEYGSASSEVGDRRQGDDDDDDDDEGSSDMLDKKLIKNEVGGAGERFTFDAC
jgi:hypothetical protein